MRTKVRYKQRVINIAQADNRMLQSIKPFFGSQLVFQSYYMAENRWQKNHVENMAKLAWRYGQTKRDQTAMAVRPMSGSKQSILFRYSLTMKLLSPPLVTWPGFAYVFPNKTCFLPHKLAQGNFISAPSSISLVGLPLTLRLGFHATPSS